MPEIKFAISESSSVLNLEIPLEELGLARAKRPTRSSSVDSSLVDCTGCGKEVKYSTAFQYTTVADNGRDYRAYVCSDCLLQDFRYYIDDMRFSNDDPNAEVPFGAECEVCEQSCEGFTDNECRSCGVPACKNCCIEVRNYYTYGPSWLCFNCYEEHFPETAERNILARLTELLI